jgi:cation:H+ antiporter
MDAMDLTRFLIGLLLLIGGGELLVRGASRLANMIGISPLVVGLTVIALGTSSPELAVSIQSAVQGNPDIALGNVVGSNIFNVLFILGLSALIARLRVDRQLIRLDVPVMVGVSVILMVLALDNRIGRFDGIILMAGFSIYVLFLIRLSRRRGAKEEVTDTQYPEQLDARKSGFKAIAGQLMLGAAGLALLIVGATWLVDSAVSVASAMGVSSLLIGLTVVAAGTSLPEVATSIIAAVRGQRDIAVGNVVGSNIMNVLVVLGLTSVVAPDGITVPAAALHFDIPIMIVVAVACLPIFFTGHSIERWEGLIFFGYYVAYTVYLILDATGHDALETYSIAMLYFVLPLTALTFVIITIRIARERLGRGTVPQP